MSPTRGARGRRRWVWSRLGAATAALVSLLLMITAAPAYAADTDPPTIDVPSDITIVSARDNVRPSYIVNARDDVDGPRVPVTCSPGPEDRFPFGRTQVTCTARDAAGNVGSESFYVTIVRLTVELSLQNDAPGRTRVVDQDFPTITATVTRSDGVSTADRVVTFKVTGGAGFAGSGLQATATVGAGDRATAPTLTAGRVAGNYAVSATVVIGGVGFSATTDAPISVLAGPTSRLRVRGPATLQPRVEQTFSVEQTDQYDNVSTLVPAGSPTLTITPDSSCSGSTCRLSTLGAHTVRADWGGFSGTTQVTGVPGPLASMDITPVATGMLAGQTTAYQVIGFDADRYRIGDVTSSTTFTIAPNGSCSASSCTATIAGRHTVTATNGTVSTQATLTVDPAYAASIRVTSPTASILAGGSATYTVRAYDTYGNLGDDISTDSLTELTISPDGSCTGATCTAKNAGPHTVTAVYDASLRDTTALGVAPAAASEIRLTRSATSFDAGGGVALSARAYDQYGNAGDDVTSATRFSIAPDGSCTGTSCTTTVAGPHTVTGVFGSLSATTPVTVTPAVATQVRLTLGSPGIVAGGTTTYAVRAYDRYGNAGDDVTTDPLTEVRISPDGSCANRSCTAMTAGAHTVTAIFDGGASDSASLAVTPAAASEIRLSRSAATVPAGTAVTFTARAYDQYGNAGDNVTGSTTFTIAPDGGCTGATCTATVVGAHTVTAAYGSLRATVPLTVKAATAAQVEVRDGDSQQVTTGSAFPVNLSVKVTDLYGNAVPGATVTFAVTGGPAAFGGAASTTAVTTDDGVATAARLTAGSTTGSVTVTAGTGSTTAATFLESVITTAAARADLAVTLTGPATYTRSGSATLTVKITNKGPNPATNLSTLLVVGCGLSVTNGGGGTVRGSSVLFSTATLASGASQTWTVTVKTAANPPRTVSAGAVTLSAVRDPSYANNVASTSGRTS